MKKQKIAVIGGGVGAITSVFAITKTPDWQSKYDITIYQMGWRLGGKGASGRNMEKGARIEEHGLHVWAGFYDNAFRNMRDCYEQLVTLGLRQADGPLGTIDKAFKPLDHLLLSERVTVGDDFEWRPWLIDLPKNDQVPGTATTSPTPFDMFRQMLVTLREFLKTGQLTAATQGHLDVETFEELLQAHKKIHLHATAIPTDPKGHLPSHTTILLELIRSAQDVCQRLQTPENVAHDATRRLLYLMDISLASAHGMVSSDVFCGGYDVLDQWEFTEWLRLNSGGARALDSVLMRACYDFVFGFSQGDISFGNVGAGTGMRAMSRLVLNYSGAIFQEMQAGMGDTIFAPYYQVLQSHGVKFKYFNAATALRLNDTRTAIEAIEMVEQAATKTSPYTPLVDIKDLPCWPSTPLWDQLVDGEKLKASGIDFEDEKSPPTGKEYRLERGRDFDLVILGASMGSLPYLTADLSAASERWRRMLDRVETVGTHAAQFWMTKTAKELGWEGVVAKHNPKTALPKSPYRTMITGFAEPLDTWANMSHLLPVEDWSADGPKSVAYFCSPAPDGETLPEFKDSVAKWADSSLTKYWPDALKGKKFDLGLLYAPEKTGKSAFDYQYFRVNMYGSERYVLSVKNSVSHRLAPDESGFSNLFLAGDWTRSGLNAGCVEGATMSGIAAASAVTGIDIPNIGADDISLEDNVVGKSVYQTNSISDAPWPLSSFFARGSMNGWFMFYVKPREEVQALLPKGLHLGHAPGVAPDMHPVGLSLCRYHNVRSSFIPHFMAMRPYHEASFAIPNVMTEEGGRAPFLYPKRLYVDSSAAIFAGRKFYAMDKVSAAMTMDDRKFTASTTDKKLFIDADFQQQKDVKPMSEHPAFGALSDMLNISFVTTRDSKKFNYNAFNMQLERAYIAPVSGHISVNDPNEGGFPAIDMQVQPLLDAPTNGILGAFRIWTSWSLANPLDSKRIRHASKARAFLRRTY